MARRAVQLALRMMQPHDRVSVVSFDGHVETVVTPQLVEDPQALCRVVEGVTSRGNTALHAGWLEGTMFTAQFHDPRARSTGCCCSATVRPTMVRRGPT